ncbi:MAG: copper chaperone PCu(A)C, partial [Dehalococcoidia bacterium]|nr:copper chaperone PCu(A)C [Dehalococcoidia bacterium]
MSYVSRLVFDPLHRMALAAVAALVVVACAPNPSTGGSMGGPTDGSATIGDLRISGAWVRALGGGHGGHGGMPMNVGRSDDGGHGGASQNTAAYFVIRNTGQQPDTLVSARADIANVTELHVTTITNNVARMQMVPQIEVPAGATVEFRPQGNHVMLIGVKGELKVGQTVPI